MAMAFTESWRELAEKSLYDCNKLAKLKKVSVRQLQRIFVSKLGRTPQEWLNEQRLLAAQQMLLAGDPVKKVALDLGFKQSSHFCRQFKLLSGVTPSEFKSSANNSWMSPMDNLRR